MSKQFKKAYIEITNVCNLSCSFCPGTTRPPLFMGEDAFALVLDRLAPYTDYVYLHLMGEPLLHPSLSALLSLCATRGLRVNLTTNGTLISSVKQNLLTAPALRKIGFSLHSFEANLATRPLADYLGDILSFAGDAADAGVICELRLWNGGGEDAQNAEILRLIAARFGCSLGEELAMRGGAKLRERVYLGFAERFDWPDSDVIASEPSADKPAFCYGLRDQIGVLSDGTVVPCCLDSEGTIALGNILRTPLDEILVSPRAVAIYDGFSRRAAIEPLCKACGYARRFTEMRAFQKVGKTSIASADTSGSRV